MIYEGTNEIQAIDLLVRKVLPDGAKAFGAWLVSLRADLEPGQPNSVRVLDNLAALEKQTGQLVSAAARDGTLAHWVADDYLRAVALVLLDWAWAQIEQKTAAQDPRWSAPAHALQRWVMPELTMRLGIMASAMASVTTPDTAASTALSSIR
jgi:hypothetical protein